MRDVKKMTIKDVRDFLVEDNTFTVVAPGTVMYRAYVFRDGDCWLFTHDAEMADIELTSMLQGVCGEINEGLDHMGFRDVCVDILEQAQNYVADCESGYIDVINHWDAIASYMDDDAREKTHFEVAPCTEKEFLLKYLEYDPDFEKLLDDEFGIDVTLLKTA